MLLSNFVCCEKLENLFIKNNVYLIKYTNNFFKFIYKIKIFIMKPAPPSMNLKQFMNSRQVLKLYRDILRTIKLIPNEGDKEYMRNWVRSDFKTYKNVTDDLHIKALLSHGENSLQELRRNLNLSK